MFSSKSSRKPNTCFALHTHMHYALSQNGEMLSKPRVALVPGSATSSGPWRGVFCETRGEEGGTACLHSPPALHSGGEHCQRLILGRRSPSLLLEGQPRSSLRAMNDILGISQVQIPIPPVPPVPGPCHAQVCPSQLPSLDSVRGCRWIWNCVTFQMCSGLGSPTGGALSDRLRNTTMSP